jgi:type IV pilus assembly protein PilM
MQRAKDRAGFSAGAGHVGRLISRAFPTPKLLAPTAAGVDISDASIKWIVLNDSHGVQVVESWGQQPLEEGIVVSGVVRDQARLVLALLEMRKKLPHIHAAHAALPEEAAFVFDMSVPTGSSREQIRNIIEFEFDARVPIPPSAAVYDFDRIPVEEGAPEEISVVVFPRELAESYAQGFESAGMTLLSLELEARSIARAVCSPLDRDPITLLVDFGLRRTGFAVLKQGIPIFTSTVDVGGEMITRALEEKLKLAGDQIEAWKNDEGLLPAAGPKSPGIEAVSGTASALGSEVARHFHYWDTRRNETGERATPVSRVLLVGGGANLKGLGDYIAGRVQAEVIRPNLWQNICSFDDYIPPLDRRLSLQYATAIGLAMRGI